MPWLESWTAQHCQKWVYQEAEEIKYLGARGRAEKQESKNKLKCMVILNRHFNEVMVECLRNEIVLGSWLGALVGVCGKGRTQP